MARSDFERWNRKYGESEPHEGIRPDPLLPEHADLLRGRGRALDLACGLGDNALYLAQLGNEVFAVDISEAAIQRLAGRARKHRLVVRAFVADLDVWRPPRAQFDLVTVFRFLDRQLIGPVKEALRPGGLLVYRTWNLNHLAEKPDFRPDYLLGHGELSSLMRGLRTVAANDAADNPAADSWWIGENRPAS
jgi:SAM-dependent methyltransferase